MTKRRSGPSVSAVRPARRPLTEFVTPIAGSGVVRPLRPAPTVDARPPARRRDRGAELAPEPSPQKRKANGQEAAAEAKPKSDFSAKPGDGDLSQAIAGAASVVTTVGRHYRSWLIEHAKCNIAGALGYASGLVSTRSPREASKPPASTPANDADAKRSNPTPLRGDAAELCASALKIYSANVSATLDYARQLSDVTSLAEFVRLSTSQTRQQIEMMMAQAAALGALSHTLLTGDAGSRGEGTKRGRRR